MSSGRTGARARRLAPRAVATARTRITPGDAVILRGCGERAAAGAGGPIAALTLSMHASINSTDATRGQPLRVRVEKRMLELRAIAAGLDDGDPTRQDIASALAVVQGMLTGPRHHLPPMVAADLNRWLERNKHLAEYVATFQRRAIAS